jgi:DNA primase
VSHTDRIVFPEDGITKRELAELGKPDLRGAHFNLRNALARYRRSGDPWLQQPCRAQSLSAAVQRELERRTA